MGGKILVSRKGEGGGDPLTGFIYTSDLVRAFTSRVVRSAGPVSLRGDSRGLVAFSREPAVFRKYRCGCADCYQHNRLLLMVRLRYSRETRKKKSSRRLTAKDCERLEPCRFVWANKHSVIMWLAHFIAALYSYCIVDNDINKTADNKIITR